MWVLRAALILASIIIIIMLIMGIIVKVIVLAVICGLTLEIDNGLALTPPLAFAQGGCEGD